MTLQSPPYPLHSPPYSLVELDAADVLHDGAEDVSVQGRCGHEVIAVRHGLVHLDHRLGGEGGRVTAD